MLIKMIYPTKKNDDPWGNSFPKNTRTNMTNQMDQVFRVEETSHSFGRCYSISTDKKVLLRPISDYLTFRINASGSERIGECKENIPVAKTIKIMFSISSPCRHVCAWPSWCSPRPPAPGMD